MSNKTENYFKTRLVFPDTKAAESGSGFIPARDLNSSVLKGIWWMPRRSEAKKDVAGCDKLRLGVNTRLTRRSPNEETPLARVIPQ